MKLTIDHLMPYFAHELHMTRNGFVGELIAINKDGRLNVSCSQWWEGVSDKNHYKPILRPLSDLTKEITHNGETFVPFQKVAIFKDEYSLKEEALTGFVPVIVFNMLCEWKFDVFSLIEGNLAIDLNTLNENPYK